MLGVRDSQPKYHSSDTDPALSWRLGAVANRCLINSAVQDGKAVYDFTDHLAAYTKPVLFVASAKNEVIGVAFQQRQKQFFPASELVTIADSGHDMQWTHPAESLAVIRAYLGAVQP
jgi:pimeloyl-ACP methyl ester carboxylesterase